MSILARLLGRESADPAPRAPASSGSPPVDPAMVEALRGRLRRRAIVMQIGGFRPPEGPGGSWFGRVNLALPGEGWPTSGGRPLHALAQIDLAQLPFCPPRLDDVAVITIFIAGEPPYDQEPNGEGWCLRAYPDRAALVPLEPVDTGSEIKTFPMRAEIVEDDYGRYPEWQGLDVEIPEDIESRYDELFPAAEGFKLGGWPFLLQSEIEWGPEDSPHPARPEYVFQIDSTDKGNWSWGDSGVGYFGRGTRPGRTGEWALAWQSL